MDRDTIISWAVLIIVALLALNYLHFDCNGPKEHKPVKGFMDFEKQDSYQKQPGDAPQHSFDTAPLPVPGGSGGNGGGPRPGTPAPDPSPGGPPPGP